MFNNTFEKSSTLYHEYPHTFWMVAAITLVDRMVGALIFPFLALYITSKFSLGMRDVRALLGGSIIDGPKPHWFAAGFVSILSILGLHYIKNSISMPEAATS
jgi:hypothetical protein